MCFQKLKPIFIQLWSHTPSRLIFGCILYTSKTSYKFIMCEIDLTKIELVIVSLKYSLISMDENFK